MKRLIFNGLFVLMWIGILIPVYGIAVAKDVWSGLFWIVVLFVVFKFAVWFLTKKL